MNFDLSAEHKAWQRLVRDFCTAELLPYAAQVDQTGELRWEAMGAMRDVGLLGLDVPEAYGGIAADPLSIAIAIEELGRACGSTALSLAAHNGLGCAPIARWGTTAQQSHYFPELLDGSVLGALALTEPDAGSDLAGGVQTTAKHEGDAWIVNGSKAWITNAVLAPVITVLLRTDPDAGTNGFSMMLIETTLQGVNIGTPEKKMGLKGSPTSTISFDHVRVPDDAILGTLNRGFQQTMEILDAGRIGIGALSVGLAQAALDEAARYAKARRAFGKPIASHQAIQWMLADAALAIEASRMLVYKAAWLREQGRNFSLAAAMAKLKASETAEKVAHDALQILGSYGYSAEYPVERIYRDQRLMAIGEGTSEIQRLVIARNVLAGYE